nr:hypothetical protein [Tanacetum cinerariifolium]
MLNANITFSPAIVHHHTVVKPSSKKPPHRSTESANTSDEKKIEATRNKKTVLPLNYAFSDTNFKKTTKVVSFSNGLPNNDYAWRSIVELQY